VAPLYHYNPLLFDFVLKRTVKAPGTADRFPPAVFMQRPGQEPRRAVGEPLARQPQI